MTCTRSPGRSTTSSTTSRRSRRRSPPTGSRPRWSKHNGSPESPGTAQGPCAGALDGFRTLETVDRELDEIRRLEHEGDQIYREALAGLFRASVDPMVVIRWKDIYQGLEDSVDSCRHAANVLQRIVVKNA